MFATALPMKKCSVPKHLSLVVFLSQKPLTGLPVKSAIRTKGIHQPATTAITISAASLYFGTEKIQRYKEGINSLIIGLHYHKQVRTQKRRYCKRETRAISREF